MGLGGRGGELGRGHLPVRECSRVGYPLFFSKEEMNMYIKWMFKKKREREPRKARPFVPPRWVNAIHHCRSGGEGGFFALLLLFFFLLYFPFSSFSSRPFILGFSTWYKAKLHNRAFHSRHSRHFRHEKTWTPISYDPRHPYSFPLGPGQLSRKPHRQPPHFLSATPKHKGQVVTSH